jgi:hypothetical protein
MTKLTGGIALLFLVAATGSGAHADGSWCAYYDVSTYNCGFHSWEQCYETVRGGAGGWCRPNYFKSNAAAPPTRKKTRTNRM